MTLTTHALIGAAAAALAPHNPVEAFALGFMSHFASDAIPHWDYSLNSLHAQRANMLESYIEPGQGFIKDIGLVSFDALLGFALGAIIFSLWLFNLPLAAVLAAALGALVPDGLHFIYFKTHVPLLVPLERFHNWIQTKSPIDVPAWVGIGLQCALFIAVLALAYGGVHLTAQ